MLATTRCFRSDRLLTILATGLAALVAALVGLAVASPAQAETSHTWSASTSTVCVESHVASDWDVRTAIRRWNRLEGGPTFVLETSCPDYNDTVTVSYKSQDDQFTGWTTWFWDTTGSLIHADVTVNPHRMKAFASQEQSCQRNHTMTHEFGHALGLRHYLHSHAGSVMSYLGWARHCGGLSAHDRAEFAQLYPANPATLSPDALVV